MKNVILITSVLMLVSCGINKMVDLKEIYTHLYDSPSVDSINIVLFSQQIPITLAKGKELDTLVLGEYDIIISNFGYCFEMIVETPNYYLVNLSEYVVGYDILFLYERGSSTMYQTEIYNVIQEPYKVQYETCNFEECTIDVIYEGNSIKHVHFNKCTSEIIRL